jgi:hypothetical protein
MWEGPCSPPAASDNSFGPGDPLWWAYVESHFSPAAFPPMVYRSGPLPLPPTQPQATCSQHGFGFGVSGGGNADLGAGFTGVTATGSLGGGLFYSGQSGASGGAFEEGGAAAYFLGHVASAPSQAHQPFSLFGFLGGGLSAFVTNAGSAQQLAGPFTSPQRPLTWASVRSSSWRSSPIAATEPTSCPSARPMLVRASGFRSRSSRQAQQPWPQAATSGRNHGGPHRRSG